MYRSWPNVEAQVSDRLVCDIAHGFWEELTAGSSNSGAAVASRSVLEKMHRKRATKHENTTSQIPKDEGLSCPIPVDYVMLDGGVGHEIFRIESYLKLFSLHEKLPLLLGHVNNLGQISKFWSRFKKVYPSHPIFSYHRGREDHVLPVCFHADEGRTLKKSQIMVMNLQPLLGGNPDPAYDPDEMHMNFKYSSYATRLLMTVMCKRVYRKSFRPLKAVLDSIAQELLHLWTTGVEVQLAGKTVRLYMVAVACKGDWPILAKVGHLVRWFGRATRNAEDHAVGICHLCLAGKSEHPLHDCSEGASWRSTFLMHSPFSNDPSTFAVLPYHDPLFYRYDIFHCGHKGIMAELAGSALATVGILRNVLTFL